MDLTNETDALEKLRTMAREADERRLSNASFSDFRIWHAVCCGRLQSIFGSESKHLAAWVSLVKEFNLEEFDAEMYLYGEIDSGPAEGARQRVEELGGRDAVMRELCYDRMVEARRILLDYITLAASSFSGEVLPARFPERLDLGFIDDPRLKRLCGDLYRQAIACVRNQCYEASIIMLGSLLEGVLYSVAEQRRDEVRTAEARQRNRKNQSITDSLDKWELVNLIEVAAELKWISKETKTRADLLRQYRNYVHPAKHVNHAPTIDKISGEGAINAVESCIRDINNWLKENPDQA